MNTSENTEGTIEEQVIEETKEAGGEAREDVQETVGDVEAGSTNSETPPTKNTPSGRL
ncbi:hypothetical protein [Halorubrum trueperi]|uniref:Uncharacterized protein n=1 Tax=Halorubrum trueperi TaxID=2004704 RepID=A0ABD5UHX8_9EURY